jgi:AcrR family transcriptional regulator
MALAGHAQPPRKRAPSKRALATRARILDAAEKLFAANGFDGTSLRDIAAEAGVAVGLVHHHGHSKDDLFLQTVARRAKELSAARLAALEQIMSQGPVTPSRIFTAFFAPYLNLARSGAHWLAYARLVAHVSVDPRWRGICAECFDTTAERFLDEIARLFPQTPRPVLARAFVYSVSAMLAHLTTQWRIETLGGAEPQGKDAEAALIAFCASGLQAVAQTGRAD